MDSLASLTLSVEANALDLDDVVCILCQIPEHTGPVCGVHLPDESLHLPILSLPEPGRLLKLEASQAVGQALRLTLPTSTRRLKESYCYSKGRFSPNLGGMHLNGRKG